MDVHIVYRDDRRDFQHQLSVYQADQCAAQLALPEMSALARPTHILWPVIPIFLSASWLARLDYQ